MGIILYPVISITSSFNFFSVHDILITLLMYHISAASSLLSRYFVRVPLSYPCRPCVVFLSVDFGKNSDISIREDGLHLVECIFRQSYSL